MFILEDWTTKPMGEKSARTEGAEAFIVCLREPLAIALSL
jgi:hypothetical protein